MERWLWVFFFWVPGSSSNIRRARSGQSVSLGQRGEAFGQLKQKLSCSLENKMWIRPLGGERLFVSSCHVQQYRTITFVNFLWRKLLCAG